MSTRVPVPRVVPGDVEILERRARALATGAADRRHEGSGALRIVSFRLGGAACALDAENVERAVSRLGSAISVPLVDGTDRSVAFVEERPVPLVDLAGFAAGAPRSARDLAGTPALVIAMPDGPVAMAVDGPLELSDEQLAARASEGATGARLRITGRLSGGAALLDPAWLVEWVTKVIA